LDALQTNFDLLKAKLTTPVNILGIGIGAPDANSLTGNLEDPHNLNWGGLIPLKRDVEAMLGLDTIIANDANAAALSEMQFGAAKGMKNFVVLTLGTGLGSGIVVNEKLLLGENGMAGEMGHVNIRHDGRQCKCGLTGCLETYVSVTGIKRTVFKFLADMSGDSPLRRLNYDQMTGEDITEAALAGDEIAQAAFAYTGRILGTKLADAVAYLEPEAIILTGGLTRAGNLLLEPTNTAMENSLFYVYKGKVRLLISALGGKYDAVMGAASLYWDKLKNEELVIA